MKISIITASYNAASSIERTINSILMQTYDNIEYIIIDGGSTDSTNNIIEKYQDNIDIYISEKDDGIYDALNKGISLSSGDVIGFLHADDFYPQNDIIKKVSNLLIKNRNVDIVYGDIAFIDKRKTIKRYYSGESFNFDIGIMPPHPSTFIRAKCYDIYGNFDKKYIIASDYELMYRFIEINGLEVLYSKDIIVYMSLGGISNQNIFSSYFLNKEIFLIHKRYGRPLAILKLLKKIPIRLNEKLSNWIK